MVTPRVTSFTNIENNANDLSTLFAFLMPQSAEDVRGFIWSAALALDVNEAELAALLGVSRSTLSGWKSRGSIPAKYRNWFEEEFCYAVFSRGFSVRQGEDLRHVGLRIALRIFRTTDFNPFGIDNLKAHERFDLSFWYLQSICHIGHFVLQRLPLDVHIEERDQFAADLVTKIMHFIRPRLRPHERVSQ